MEILHVNTENFEQEVLKNAGPVLVDFYADWCGPCKMLAPVLEELAKELDGKVKVCKLNVDDSSKIAADYSVMTIPTLILFKDGKDSVQTVGFKTKNDIISEFGL